jgi:hypothetical protein
MSFIKDNNVNNFQILLTMNAISSQLSLEIVFSIKPIISLDNSLNYMSYITLKVVVNSE